MPRGPAGVSGLRQGRRHRPRSVSGNATNSARRLRAASCSGKAGSGWKLANETDSKRFGSRKRGPLVVATRARSRSIGTILTPTPSPVRPIIVTRRRAPSDGELREGRIRGGGGGGVSRRGRRDHQPVARRSWLVAGRAAPAHR